MWSGSFVFIAALFFLIQGGVSAYAVIKGGAPERILGWMLLIAFLASIAIGNRAVATVAVATLMIDATLLAAMIALALKANRYWTLWVAGIHATTVATHLIKALNPALLPQVYSIAAAISSFPILCVLTVATFRHSERVRRFGTDPSWSDYFDPSMALPPQAGRLRY